MCQTCVIRILANGRIFSIKNPDIGHSSPPNIWLYQLKFSHSSSDMIVLHLFGCNISSQFFLTWDVRRKDSSVNISTFTQMSILLSHIMAHKLNKFGKPW